MTHGDFVWCDLSSRRLEIAQRFYSRLFCWQYETLQATDGSDYLIAANTDAATAGLYTMPEKFQAIGMPCFWMSYIAVSSVEQAIADGIRLGGKVEVGPLDWGDGSRIALIRDPLGAGFTVVEGGAFSPRSRVPQHGSMAWNALYVSNADPIIPFYQALFDWRITPQSNAATRYDVTGISAQRISTIHELPTEQRGEEQYWAVHFAVDDLAAARESIVAGGGQFEALGGESAFVRDPDGAALFLDALA